MRKAGVIRRIEERKEKIAAFQAIAPYFYGSTARDMTPEVAVSPWPRFKPRCVADRASIDRELPDAPAVDIEYDRGCKAKPGRVARPAYRQQEDFRMAAPDSTANQLAAAQRSTAPYQVKPPVATIQPGKAVPDGPDQSAIIQTLAAQVAELQEAVARLQQALSTGTGPNSVTLYSSGRVNIHGAADVQIDAGAQVTVNASSVHLQSPMVKASGVLQCSTLIANSVIAASYTPGAGNVW